MLKNLTITVEEDALRWAKKKAAEDETSVSRMVGKILEREMRLKDDYAQAHQKFLKARARLLAAGTGIDASQRMTREEANTRPPK